LTEQTRQAVDDYLRAATKKPGEFMFTGRRGSERSITTRQYARLVSEWIACIGRQRPGWDAIPAVRNDRIVEIKSPCEKSCLKQVFHGVWLVLYFIQVCHCLHLLGHRLTMQLGGRINPTMRWCRHCSDPARRPARAMRCTFNPGGRCNCLDERLRSAARRAVSSRRKTSKAVITRTIIDGTTDMKASSDWIALPMSSW
jgi:hypothetical protein